MQLYHWQSHRGPGLTAIHDLDDQGDLQVPNSGFQLPHVEALEPSHCAERVSISFFHSTTA